MTALPELFRHYPTLRTKLPWTALASPTPVQTLDFPSHPLPGGRLWIKRDDKTSDVYGGHEARELEFLLGDALRRGATRLLCFGHVSSTRGLALASLARRFDLEIVLVLAGRPDGSRTRWLRQQEQRLGASVHPLHEGPRACIRLLRHCMTPSAQRGKPRFPVVLWPRKAFLLETLGAMNGIFELQRQIRCGLLPEPESIHVGSDSLPTLAGLAAGCELAGLRSRLVAPRPDLSRPARQLANRALRFLQARVPDLPATSLRADRIECLAEPPGEAAQAVRTLSRTPPGFDWATATSDRVLRALLDDVGRSASRGGPRLFWYADAPQRLPASQPTESPWHTSPAHA